MVQEIFQKIGDYGPSNWVWRIKLSNSLHGKSLGPISTFSGNHLVMKIWRGPPRWHYRIEEFEARRFFGDAELRCPKFEKRTGNFVLFHCFNFRRIAPVGLGDFFFPTHHEVSGLNRFVSS